MNTAPVALLIHPPVYDFAFYDNFAGPYGLLKVGRWLEAAGYEVRFVNALDRSDPHSAGKLGSLKRRSDGTGRLWKTPAEPPAPVAAARRYGRYGITRDSFRLGLREAALDCDRKVRPLDVILVGTGMTYWYEGVRETVSLCREMFPDAPVIAGGVYASLMPEHCERVAGVDHAVAGEAYPALSRLLSSLRLPAPNAPPTEAVLPLAEVWRDSAVIRLNRGCPMSCSYCSSRLLCPGFTPGDPDAAFRSVLELHERCGTVNFAFYDDALLAQKHRVLLPFLERVAASGLPVRFYTPNAVHIRSIDAETARLMRRSGFQELRLGFESSSPEFHETHDRKVRQDEFPAALETLEAAGFPRSAVGVYILAGLPGMRAEEVESSVRYARSTGVRVMIAEYSPVPGTALWEASVKASAFPLAEEPLYHNNTLLPCEWEGFTRADLERLKVLARQPL